MQQRAEIASWLADTVLADKSVYGNQTLADRVDCQEETFKSYGIEQREAAMALIGISDAQGDLGIHPGEASVVYPKFVE
jgi:hypothetical protein